uniref:Type III effector HopO1-1 n=1 Tax=Ganoderma boninense TaxID=34458 RepID=A0A5K1JWN0_9APHY|nr:Type III effector HopO1-1 [Ganoderma boninense]
MLARRALQGLARPLTRLSSSSTPVPAHEATTPATAAPQSPNFANTWSTSQRPRPQQHSSPRFEQTIMELQPSPLSAMEMINKEPIRVVHGRKAVCDGGGGPLGHPKIFINLLLVRSLPPFGSPCVADSSFLSSGLRFEQAPHHH